ncbi:MAG TPA: hypothetical protein VHE81_09620 [Lacipirellulaceae bacterium]|nr:hypothetical protein [Lacipirellulaceae bacterium]
MAGSIFGKNTIWLNVAHCHGMEFWSIGAGRKCNVQFIFMTGFMIVLRETFSEVGCGGPYDWIGIAVVVRIAAKHGNSDHPLL